MRTLSSLTKFEFPQEEDGKRRFIIKEDSSSVKKVIEILESREPISKRIFDEINRKYEYRDNSVVSVFEDVNEIGTDLHLTYHKKP